MESVWWAFKQLYEAGKIYEGRKVLMYDTKFATPVSKAEVTMDNDAYQTVTDPSAYVKFKRVDADEYFLAWTTTPWTLMANRALAVSKDLEYGIYNIDGGKLIVAKKRAEQIFGSATPEKTIKGKDLAGLEYESLDGTICKVYVADFVGSEEGTGIVHIAPAYGEDDYELYKKYSTEGAQGIPSEDHKLGRTALSVSEEGAPKRPSVEGHDSIGFIDVLDENGYYIEEYADKLHALGVRDTDEHGIQIWAANKFIAKCLEEKGIIYKIEYIQHEYPFNPRSKERIMYRAFPSWFFDIEGQKPLMLAENENINWFPDYLKHGRFAKNIEAAPDWNLSRDRFWATAMPVWKSKEGTVLVIGSYEELEKYSGKKLEDYHRPWVDEIEFDAYVADGQVKSKDVFSRPSATNEERVSEVPPVTTGGHERVEKKASSTSLDVHLEHFTRIEKVLDCWFESGSMPFAQLHYPFENKEKFENNYPADFIVEYVGQVRAWFYYVHAVNTTLAEIGAFGEKAKKGHKNAYKNVITTGTLAGNDGRKMSKSLGNYTDPNVLMDTYSADALRFLLLSSPVLSGEDFALLDKDVSDVHRKLAMLWNVYDFFTTYAEIDNIDSEDLNHLRVVAAVTTRTSEPTLRRQASAKRNDEQISSNPLDIWILSRMYELRNEITEGMEEYNIPKALDGVLPFIDDLSNWFVRRSRRRFSKNDDASDKNCAFATLYYVLVYTTKLLAPFTPFLSEELYQKMTGENKSIHLKSWPEAGEINTEVLDKMSRTREIITDALALRMQKSDTEEQIKIRQPLSKLAYTGDKLDDFYEQIIMDEVNVKKIENGDSFTLDKTLTEELKREGYARDLIRAIQSARKNAKLAMDDHIKLSLSVALPEGFEDLVKSETLVDDFAENANYTHDEIVKVGNDNITISLEKI